MWPWNEDKRQANLAKHGVDFANVARFDWVTAIIEPDTRFDYGELRQVATGELEGRLYIVTFTLRGEITRIINMRKANGREVQKWINQKS